MSLHNGLDTIGIASFGVYSSTYGVGEEGNIANLAASFGLLEDAPQSSGIVKKYIKWFFGWF